jgi:hypothetical protein
MCLFGQRTKSRRAAAQREQIEACEVKKVVLRDVLERNHLLSPKGPVFGSAETNLWRFESVFLGGRAARPAIGPGPSTRSYVLQDRDPCWE